MATPMKDVSIGSILPTSGSCLSRMSSMFLNCLQVFFLLVNCLIPDLISYYPLLVVLSIDRVSKKQIGAERRVGDLYIMESLHIPIESTSTAMLFFP